MNPKVYPVLLSFLLFPFSSLLSQVCAGFTVTCTTAESRCAATGSITINAAGGSGNYSYKVSGPVNTGLTSSSTITGLPAGTYSVYVKDMVSGCIVNVDNVAVAGTYSDPRYDLVKTDETCSGAGDGTISVANLQYGRSPFTYTIVAPSPAGVGTSNITGSFTGLIPGDYYIRLTDSCGGIQTRTITILANNWLITNTTVSKITCNQVSVLVELADNKGNTNAGGTAFSAFMYGAVNSPGDTSWFSSRSFNYTQSPLRSITFVVKDGCGAVKSFSWTNTKPSLNNSATTYNLDCNTFSAKVTGASNFTSPQYTLKQGTVSIQSNTTGIFGNIPYGSYCIEAYDACYDTTITRCFSASAPVPSVSGTVSISNRQCSTFTAAITGQSNLFSPQYCLYDNSNTLISCNTNGIFTGISYGSYCIKITSSAPCYDTVITRCFSAAALPPALAATVSISNQTCSSFDVTAGGQSNIFSPQFCLYDNSNVLITCNTSGVFTGLAYGSYCIKLTSSTPCYDTTITRCFTATPPVPSAGNPVFTNKGCTGFDVSIPSVSNIASPQYCLYDNNSVLITCNTTGTFTGLSYGSYCIQISPSGSNGSCSITPVSKCFTVSKPVPSVSGSVIISNKVCAGFSATITGQSNLNSPQYCLYDNSNNLVTCNSTGVFNTVNYGSYCIKITDACADTTISRCFSVSPSPVSVSASASTSCTFNTTNLTVTPSGGTAPYTVNILNPVNVVVASAGFSSSNYTFNDLSALSSGQQYKVAISDNCGAKDTILVSPNPSVFSRNNTFNGKCPGSTNPNGSADFVAELTSNIGFYSPTIIKKDNTPVSISYTISQNVSSSVRKYTFSDLAPATYVVKYYISSCSKTMYDTVTVSAYQYPSLQNSAAYQCDNSSFGVNASVIGGVAPFEYSVIGSLPASPSIVSAPQASPLFNINNGSSYSLVRLRALDDCGNATLNDVSIVPLGNVTVSRNSLDCFFSDITLSVDTIPNASYTWYKRTSPTDSVLVTNGQSYNMPYLLPSDTGQYVAVVSVNSGCLTRVSNFDVTGDCRLFPLSIKLINFIGRKTDDIIDLNWSITEEDDIIKYIIQRKTAAAADFTDIGSLWPYYAAGVNKYSYRDDVRNESGKIEYRLKILSKNGKTDYSKVVSFTMNGEIAFSVMPNPVKEALLISFNEAKESEYMVRIVNATGSEVYRYHTGKTGSTTLKVERTSSMKAGMYILQVYNFGTGQSSTRKIIYQ